MLILLSVILTDPRESPPRKW